MRNRDLTGLYFGRLFIIEKCPKEVNKKTKWLCKCMCGKEVRVTQSDLVTGNTKSCGCLAGQANIKHGACVGGKDSSLYKRWQHMRDRCTNPKNKRYSDYGGRGIKVCDAWLNSFSRYKEDVGEPPKGMQLDRINNDGDYEPSNVRWATPKEQSNNRRKAKTKGD